MGRKGGVGGNNIPLPQVFTPTPWLIAEHANILCFIFGTIFWMILKCSMLVLQGYSDFILVVHLPIYKIGSINLYMDNVTIVL